MNIAQLFQNSDQGLICILHSGIPLRGTKVDGRSESKALRDADCSWGSELSEYWRALESGEKVVQVAANESNAALIGDGLYVDEARLHDVAFKMRLVGMVRALRDGWQRAAAQENLALDSTLLRDKAVDANLERRRLEQVLNLLGTNFGYFDLQRYEQTNSFGLSSLPSALSQQLWTHDIYEAALEDGQQHLLSSLIKGRIQVLRSSPFWALLMWVAEFSYAVAGSILALRMGYRFWGRLILAAIITVGGGVLRDVLIGGPRYPIWLTKDPRDLYVIIAGALVTTLLAHVAKQESTIRRVDQVATSADAFGFAVIAVNGASIAAVSDLPIIWIPLAAALSVAGGGVMLDVVARREHNQYKKDIYEEVAVIAALLVLGALIIADRLEHLAWLPHASMIAVGLLAGGVRYAVMRFGLTYPTRRHVLAFPIDRLWTSLNADAG